MAGPLDDIFEQAGQEERQRRAQVANRIAYDPRAPAEVVRNKRLAKNFGLEMELVESDPEYLEGKQKEAEVSSALDEYPWMFGGLKNTDAGLLMGKDDLPKLGSIGKALGMSAPSKLEAPNYAKMFPDLRGTPAPKQLPSYGSRVGTTTLAVVGMIANQFQSASQGALENYLDAKGFDETLEPLWRGLEENNRVSNEKLQSSVSDWVTPGFKQGAFSAAVSMGSMGVSAAVGGPAGVLPILTGLTYGSAYQKYQGRGLSMGKSMAGAGIEAGIEWGTERGPTKYLTSKLGKGTAKDFLLQYVLADAGGEQVAAARTY